MKIFLYILSVVLLLLSGFVIFVALIVLAFGGEPLLILPLMVLMGVVLLSAFVMMWKIYKANRDLVNMVVSINEVSALNTAETFFYGGLGMIAAPVGVGVAAILDAFDISSIIYNTKDFLETLFPQAGRFQSDMIGLSFLVILLVVGIVGFYLSFFFGLKLLKLRR